MTRRDILRLLGATAAVAAVGLPAPVDPVEASWPDDEGDIALPTAVLCMAAYQDYLYVGCEDGLYRVRQRPDLQIEKVDSRRTQSLAVVGGDLYFGGGNWTAVGHHSLWRPPF